MVDTGLVEQARRGNQEAFATLAPALGDRLFGLAQRILRDADLAADATQESLVIIWRQLPQLRDVSRFEAWSYRLLVNTCRTAARHERRWSPSLRILGRGDPVQADGTALVADRDELERAFRRLSVDHRTVLALHYYRDLSVPQIARLLDIPAGTARSRLHYAHQAMRAAVAADVRTSPGVAR